MTISPALGSTSVPSTSLGISRVAATVHRVLVGSLALANTVLLLLMLLLLSLVVKVRVEVRRVHSAGALVALLRTEAGGAAGSGSRTTGLALERRSGGRSGGRLILAELHVV